jgi:2-polyprenyl-3-methyl-5-hydroxy-6-metoxy-1,4-benzoquinol methylase
MDANGKYPSWAHQYHLSLVRHNLLKWFPFNSQGSALEIGAGCGALTGLLCEKLDKVIALEYSSRRAHITAQRHSHCSNLEVFVGGLQEFDCEKQFDYITVIGVLEYAGGFYGGDNPYESFLAKLKKMLKSDGILILAIENKIGLKYLTGAAEDHTGRIFDSIYDYPSTNIVRTFCKRELMEMLHAAGFCDLKWYYPFPDYKLPHIILSDKTLPCDRSDLVWSFCPVQTGWKPRKEIISEELLGKTIAKAGLLGEFANSFLVIGGLNASSEKTSCLRFESTNQGRKPEFRTELMICQADQKKLFIKTSVTDAAQPFIKLIVEREKKNQEYFKDCFEVLCGKLKDNRIEYDYLSFPSLQDKIQEYLRQGNYQHANKLFQNYIDKINSLEKVKIIPEEFLRVIAKDAHGVKSELDCLLRGLPDLTPQNILIDGNRWIVLDNEWSFDFPMPIIFIFFRAIKEMSAMLQPEICKTTCIENPAIGIFACNLCTNYVSQAWIKNITDKNTTFSQMLRWESGFQNYVTGRDSNAVGRIKFHYKVCTHIPYAFSVRGNQFFAKLNRRLKKVAGIRRIAHFLDRRVLYWRK